MVLRALKVLHGHYAEDRSRRERFFRGARLMAKLAHPRIVRVLETEQSDDGWRFFVMEYVPGGSFEQAVLDGGLTLEQRLAIVLQVGEALEHAHKRGAVHRDVKPSNVLLDAEGHAKLSDFDLVRAEDTTGLTATRAMMGTVQFAAPEALESAGDAGPAADVYSLGATAVFAVLGDRLPPWFYRDPGRAIAELRSGEALKQVLGRATAFEVGQRFATVTEFCRALAAAAARPEPLRAPAVTAPPVMPTTSHEIRERIHEKDGSVLVYVPGGEFTLGAADLDRSKPVHRVRLSPFWIGKFAVTHEQYRCYLEVHRDRPKPAYWNDERFNAPEQPVVGVSWLDAQAYCRWAGLELPSEAQWEAAARGPEGRRFPWGDEDPTTERATFGQSWDSGRPTSVGSHPEGIGPYGAFDQAGNVWEWCVDKFEETAYRDRDGKSEPVVTADEDDGDVLRVVRGGSWLNPSRGLRAAFRHRNGAGDRSWGLGFRVLFRSGPEP